MLARGAHATVLRFLLAIRFAMAVSANAIPDCNFAYDLFSYVYHAGDAVGTVIATGVALTAFLAARYFDRRSHRKKVVELLRALRTEVIDTKNHAGDGYSEEKQADLLAANRLSKDYFPYTPIVPSDLILELIKREIMAFDHNLQEKILKFYYLERFTDAMMVDFRSSEIRELPWSRKEIFLNRYFSKGREMISAADDLIKAIDAHLSDRPFLGADPAILIIPFACLGLLAMGYASHGRNDGLQGLSPGAVQTSCPPYWRQSSTNQSVGS